MMPPNHAAANPAIALRLQSPRPDMKASLILKE